MIKASSLFYTLVVTLLIAIVSSSLILFAYYSRIQFQNFEVSQQLNRNADSGLNLLLAQQSLVELNEQKTIDLFGQGEDNVQLSRKRWGAYEIAISKAQFKGTEIMRVAQVGYYPENEHAYSLYLADHDNPVAFCGKTIVKGTAYLPAAGVKRAYIEGQSFVGNNLVDGTIKKSKNTIPEFNKALLKTVESALSKQVFSDDDSVLNIGNNLSDDTIMNSFLNTTLVLKSSNAITIAGGKYVGNIVIISNQKITVSSQASINEVILIAPHLIIEKDFKGSLQAFASDSLIVQKNVQLTYPSVLGLVQRAASPAVSALVLNQGTVVSGNVFVNKYEQGSLKEAGLIMNPGATFYGQAYSNGFADIKGEIYGSLMCTKLLLITPSSVYENHLLNAVIDLTKLSGHYVGIDLVRESKIKKVVKWLK